MLGAIIGDIVGSVYEFNNYRAKDFTPFFHPQASYTDDTVCTVAVADALLSGRHPGQVLKDWGTRYWENGGWGGRFAIWLESDSLEPYNSFGNGAAMRVLPVALACYGRPPETAIFASRAQAHVTHHNVISDAACETLTFMVLDLLAGRDAGEVQRERADELVRQFPVFAYGKKRIENPSGYVVDTIQAVFQAFFGTASFEDCLLDVVNRGGDADTTGPRRRWRRSAGRLGIRQR